MNTNVLNAERGTGSAEMLQRICAAISAARCDLNSEVKTHESIAVALATVGITFEREVRLGPGNRLDFLCARGIAIEVKLKGAKKGIYRQVQRYLAEERVQGVVVASATALRMPSIENGKPIRVVSLSRAWL